MKDEDLLQMRKKKSFDAEEYKSCANCINSRELCTGELLLCRKKGLVAYDGKCRFFELDLLSINPKKLRNIKTSLTEEDFTL